jgi:threonine/homoserine/homoserine lactone efflux protein
VQQAIGDLLPFAVGVAISPVPIIAIIVMLLSNRAGANSIAFLGGWLVGITGACVVLVLLAGTQTSGTPGDTTSSTSMARVVIGVLLLVLAVRSFRKRPKAGEAPELPKWLDHTDDLTPVKSLGLGVALSAVNPKNLALIAGGMAAVAQYDLSTGDEAIAVAVFVAIAASTVLGAIVLYHLGGDGAQHRLDELKDWMAQNNSTVMGVVLLVLGVMVLGKGLGGF